MKILMKGRRINTLINYKPFVSFTNFKNIEEVRKYWDDNSESYLTQDSGANGFYYSLLNMLKIEKRKKILEVGAGGGFLYNHSLRRKQKEAHYVATDLSEGMLSLMCKRMGSEYVSNKDCFIPTKNLTITLADGENLNKFNNSSFDCYIANLCLQITPHPSKMISEAYRVLSPGGVAGFGVWGDKKRSKFMTTVPSVLAKQFGVELPKIRSNFHLNDKQHLISLLRDAGFTQIIAWNQFSPFPYSEKEDVETLFQLPVIQEQIVLAGSRADEAKKVLKQKFEEILFKDQEPIGLDGLLVIGKKV